MSEQFQDLWEHLPAYLGGHVLLSLAALAVGLAISLPLGILASRRPRLGEWVLGVAGVLQTVPSLALLALMVVLLRGQIGFLPAFIALVLYSVLPILANTVAGIRGVDPALTEAARGLGMSDRQMLFRVELPLAAPVILAGIRTATVLVVGTATLVTPVGGKCLGNYIFAGLESINHAATVFGCVLAALLAITLDQLIRLLEVSARRRSRRTGAVAVAGLLLVVGGGLLGPVSDLVAGGERAVVASGPFTEQHILGDVLGRRLGEAGFRVDRREGMSEGIQFQALFHDQVDCMVNYTGNVWTLLMKRKEFKNSGDTFDEVRDYLRNEKGVECLGPLGFANAYAFAMTGKEAGEVQGSLVNLARYAERHRQRTGKRMMIGGDSQFFDRPEWGRVKDLYGLKEEMIETRSMDPTLMYGAVKEGHVQAIVAYSSDGRIPVFGLELLEDPRQALPPYDAVLLLSPAAARRPGVRAALAPLLGEVHLEKMRRANLRVDEEKWTARKAADELLGSIGRKKEPAP